MESIDIHNLPEDTETLQQLIISQATELRYLQEQLNLALYRRFGNRSEKNPGQHELFDESEELIEQESDTTASDDASEVIDVASHQRKVRGRKPLPEHLPRIEVIHDLDEADKVCVTDGHALHKIGEEVSEQLEIVPAKFRVIRNIRIKYGCRACETGVKTAPLPAQLIPKSMATASLLSYIAISKYADALPLYRQEQMFKRIGVELSRATLAFWMIQVGKALGPIIALLEEALLEGSVIHMDETPVQVLKEPGRKAQSQSYMWVRMGGMTDHPIVLFNYDPSRGGQVPTRLLKEFKGYLMTDGYAGYHAVTSHDITGLGCWAHARRKFKEAEKIQGKSKGSGKVQMALNEIQKIYAIERHIREKPPDERQQIREARAGPILDKMRDWLDQSLDQVAPKTTLGKALKYLDSEWPRLIRYVGDGRLPIDNNACENAIRPFVVGRKNWLFSDSQAGAESSAAIYSLIETAKRAGHEPWHYLTHVLTELPTTEPDDLHTLLPYNILPATLDD
ncbi:MAG: IS66 family transposase [Pseudomonadales bacterium]|jgi:transposase|nr:IS66 family transposase [Pseudomonadales bacterium]MDP7453083.1 IS66 family transposase [Arenicellales bacterium]HJN51894.1 IS66 family transposase [Pseudomonadales bacterium]|tara:strand:- start:159 stop:1685 length:1527 start_codon:yes stop_codon:yes gene_type:complete